MVSIGGGEGGGNRLAERDRPLINDSDGPQVMVVVIVPESELRSLLSTTPLPLRREATPGGDATNGREHKAAPQYVIGSLPVDALEALLKRQRDPVLVLHLESNGHWLDETGGPDLQEPQKGLAGGQDMLNAIAGRPSNSTGYDSQDEDSLTLREMEVLALVAKGARNRGVSDTLFISLNTVKSHMKHIMRKLKTKDRNQTALVGRIIFGGSISGGSASE